MAAIHIPRRHLIQPQGRLAVDGSGTLSNSLVVLQSDARFAVGGGIATGSPQIEATPFGAGFRCDGTKYYSSPAQFPPTSDGAFSVVIDLVVMTPPVAQRGMLSFGESALSGTPRLYIGADSTKKLMVYWSGSFRINYTGTYSANERALVIFTHDGTTGSLYLNGVLVGSATQSLGVVNAQNWYLGSGYGGQFDAVYLLQAQWARGLTLSEIGDVSANPWQIFRADPVRFYSLPSGPITLNSLTASNITSSGARFTVGLTR